ncbi:MAG: ribonuclease J [Candidatus Manganitrophaceae bacterium]|nr:MAG: ribonuclease J [Candidatus Manganitrophaceae bacterium]
MSQEQFEKNVPPLRVIPLGGLGEIGMNMMAFEYEGSIVLVDAGLMFPENDMFGVDIVIPDISYLLDPSKKVLAVFLTHGHEDHIGAVPYLLREMNVPIYGTPLTLGFLSDKLKEHRSEFLRDEDGSPITPQMMTVKPREPIFVGPFCVEPISVTHSVADSVAYAITTPVGAVIHTGDFKIDPEPVGGSYFDVERFKAYGEKGVLALFSDSTNAEREGHTGSETQVGENFERIFAETEGRIIIATFSSNIHRIDQVAQIASRLGRKIFLSGKSIIGNVKIARELGYLSFPLDQIAPLEELNGTPDREVVLITTGSQGEPMSALYRMATDDHKQIQVKPGDTVILSARVIPGNEEDISRVINYLFRKGARVLHEKIARVHVSGHASREEQQKIIEWVRPQFFIPVHGEYRQLVSHAALASKTGIDPRRILVVEDGEEIVLRPGRCEKGNPIPAGRIYIDGKGIGDVEQTVLKDRKHLGSDGMIVVTVTLDRQARKVRSGPSLLSRGFTRNAVEHPLWEEMELSLQTLLREMEADLAWEENFDAELKQGIETRIKQTLKKIISKKMNRYPMIIPNVILI